MRSYQSVKQSVLDFGLPFAGKLDASNKWVLLANSLPWDDLVQPYLQNCCSDNGRPTVDARQAVGAIIIKHMKRTSDEQTIAEIQENPYLQYFVGLPEFQTAPIFDPSLFVTLRKRLGEKEFDAMNDRIIAHFLPSKATADSTAPASEQDPSDDPPKDDSNPPPGKQTAQHDETNDETNDTLKDTPPLPAAQIQSTALTHYGDLKIDTTVAPQRIAFPTDFNLLNQARIQTEKLIDLLYKDLDLEKKPRTYRKEARKAYLAIACQKRKTRKIIRKGIKEQLAYCNRNILTINKLLDQKAQEQPIPQTDTRTSILFSTTALPTPTTNHPWSFSQFRQFWILQEVVRQQQEMYTNQTNQCPDRIVSLSQPHVRPIVRGKVHKPTEFGAKIGLSTADGFTRLDHFDWNNYGDASDLQLQVERYKKLHGYYPQSVNADKIYHTQANHQYLKSIGCRFIGKKLGRPTKEDTTPQAQHKKRQEQAQRNHIEGKIGQAKNAYGLDSIKAKTDPTSRSWVAAIIFITNLVRGLKSLTLSPKKYAHQKSLFYRHYSYFLKINIKSKRQSLFQ